MKTELNFNEFAPATKEDWKQQVMADLKGADFDKKLVWKTEEGFSLQPIYFAGDVLPDKKQVMPISNTCVKYVEITGANDVACNKMARTLKANGAEGFIFKFSDAHHHNFEVLLNGLDPLSDHISFSLSEPSAVLISDYMVHLNRSYIRAHKLDGFYECDILENWSTTGGKLKFHDLGNLLKRSKPYPNFRALVVRSHAFVNAGCNTTQELAFTLHKVSDYMEALMAEGLKPAEIIDELVLHMAIGGNYFFEIAKLRALRILLQQIIDFYQCHSHAVPIISSPALWNRSFYDPNVNMLRNTSETMSAILGGCNGIVLRAHDESHQQPSSLTQRIALNIANILEHESYLGKVADPAAGSYYIEHLTNELVESTLLLFRKIEAKGGYICAFKDGDIQAMIKEQHDQKIKAITQRRKVYVGTNKYPELNDERILPQTDAPVTDGNVLPQANATQVFEEIRSRTNVFIKDHGKITVQPLCYGNVTMRRARAAFAADFFAVAGFTIAPEIIEEDIDTLVVKAAASAANIIVLCAADEDYHQSAAGFALAFKKSGATQMLALAGYPETIIDELKNAGFNHFIHIKANCAAVLQEIQHQLSATKTGMV